MAIKFFGTYIIISPYFFAILIWFILTNKINKFLLCVFSLVMHESGHILAIYLLNEKISVLKVLPFGFSCKIKNQCHVDDKKLIKILIAGPATNLIVAGLFLFWTKEVAIINLMIGLINLLPLYELDGMRIINILMKIKH